MDWNAVIPAIAATIGTVLGGWMTWLTQASAEKRRERAQRQADHRSAQLHEINQQIDHLGTLCERVSHDVADIRRMHSGLELENDPRSVQLLRDLVISASERRDRSSYLIAHVKDEGVREAAYDVYDAWGHYLADEVESVVNGSSRPNGERVRYSPSELVESVQASLRDFRQKREAIFDSDHSGRRAS